MSKVWLTLTDDSGQPMDLATAPPNFWDDPVLNQPPNSQWSVKQNDRRLATNGNPVILVRLVPDPKASSASGQSYTAVVLCSRALGETNATNASPFKIGLLPFGDVNQAGNAETYFPFSGNLPPGTGAVYKLLGPVAVTPTAQGVSNRYALVAGLSIGGDGTQFAHDPELDVSM